MMYEVLFMVCALFFFLGCSDVYASTSARLNIPNTLPAMNQPDYWISRLTEPDRVIMTPAEIAAWNAETRKRMPETVYDMASYPATLDRSRILHYLHERAIPSAPRYFQGQQVSQSYYQALLQEVDEESLPLQPVLQYAYTVHRSNIRTFPTSDMITKEASDHELDRFQETALGPAQPVVILHTSKSKEWYFIQCYNYRGWVRTEDLALTSREAWLSYQQKNQFLVVTGERIQLETNPFTPELSELTFDMGDRLPLWDSQPSPDIVDRQISHGNHIVILPIRTASGQAEFKPALIPANAPVSVGYLPYTRAQVIRQVFLMQGRRYGWGGMFHSRDCSALIADTYKPFGFLLPRNADEQESMAGKTLPFSGSTSQRDGIFQKLQPGAPLYMPGHVMLYLGSENNQHYAIHAFYGFGDLSAPLPTGGFRFIPVNQTIVTPLSLSRTTGTTLQDSLTLAKQMDQ